MASTTPEPTPPSGNAVYTMTNSASGNSVLAFTRQADGSLTPAGSFATGGFGTGSGLGSQGALALSQDGRFLLAVDAGSDQVSAFSVQPDGLRLLNTVASGGRLPIGVTTSGGIAYVLNAGSTPVISGFTLGESGLARLNGSTRALSASAAGPAEVRFSPSGDRLVVTEKASNTIDTYAVGPGGLPGGPQANPSDGMEPFGFAFDGNDRLVVSDAASGAVTLYAVKADGSLTSLTGPVANLQTAPCWVVVTGDGRFAYVANTGSGTISGYRLTRDALSLLNADGVTATIGGVPTDMALSGDGQFLYALNGQSIVALRVGADGSLTTVSSAPVPATAVGLAAA